MLLIPLAAPADILKNPLTIMSYKLVPMRLELLDMFSDERATLKKLTV